MDKRVVRQVALTELEPGGGRCEVTIEGEGDWGLQRAQELAGRLFSARTHLAEARASLRKIKPLGLRIKRAV